MSTRILPPILALLLVLPTFAAPVDAATPVDLSAPAGAVVFTFDGGYVAGVDVSARLEAHGFRGTFYVSPGLLRQDPYYTAYMSAAEVAGLSARGHDVESMTVTQPDLTKVSDAQLASELSDSQSRLQAITGKPVDHLAYPYGAHDARVEAATAARYRSGRAVTTSPSDFLGAVDAYRLPGLMVMRSTTVEAAKSYVDFAVANRVTVILSFQNILASPGAYDWTPTQLESLLAYAQEKGVPVKTVAALVGGGAPTRPGAPALAATAGDALVDLSWSAPADGGSPITGYVLYRGESSGGEVAYRTLGTQTSFRDAGLVNGRTYYYRVSAVNAAGEGLLSNEAAATPRSATSPPPGRIVFTFDDGYRDQLPAAQKLASKGFRGTFYIVQDWVGDTGGGFMALSDVKTLAQQGHDVESHTVTHPELTTLSKSRLSRELVNSRTYLESQTGKPVRHLAYPYGAYNANVEAATAKTYATGRNFLGNPSVADLPGLLAASGSDRYAVPGIGVTKATTLARAEQYVDYAIAHDTTIILSFHNIDAAGDEYSWAPADFNALVDYVASTRVPVVTMAQAYG